MEVGDEVYYVPVQKNGIRIIPPATSWVHSKPNYKKHHFFIVQIFKFLQNKPAQTNTYSNGHQIFIAKKVREKKTGQKKYIVEEG